MYNYLGSVIAVKLVMLNKSQFDASFCFYNDLRHACVVRDRTYSHHLLFSSSRTLSFYHKQKSQSKLKLPHSVR